MQRLYSTLLVILSCSCSLMDQEENCLLLSEPLTNENIVSRNNQANVAPFNNTFFFRARRGAEVFYKMGDCYIGDYSTEWTYSGTGLIENIDGNLGTLEATSPGTLCVTVSASGNSSNQVCQEINFVRHNVWHVYAEEFPSTATYHRLILNINGRIFSGFGMNNDWFELDTASFTWTEKSHIPNLMDFDAFGGFSIGEKGYLVGNNSILYEYTPQTDTWTNIGATPFNVVGTLSLNAFDNRESFRHTVIATTAKGKGYFGMGALPFLWQYDPVSNSWEEKAQLPEKPDFYNHQFSYKGEIYFGAYVYNPSTDSWRRGTQNFNTSENLSPGFVEMGGKMLGGRNARTITFEGAGFERVEEDNEYLPFIGAPGQVVKNGVAIGNYAFFVGAAAAKAENNWFYYVKN